MREISHGSSFANQLGNENLLVQEVFQAETGHVHPMLGGGVPHWDVEVVLGLDLDPLVVAHSGKRV